MYRYFRTRHYTLNKSKPFTEPELKIESPITEIKIYNFVENYKTESRKIKSFFNGDTSKEYDINGNIISEIKIDNLYDTKTLYFYKNGILVEKKTIRKADKEKIDRKNQENERQANLYKRSTGATEYVVYDSENEEILYKAKLDNKNRFIETSSNSYKFLNNEKILDGESITKIDYYRNKISEIKSGNSKRFTNSKYFYVGDLLSRIESLTAGTEVYQQKKETKNYKYDARKNLVAIYSNNEYQSNGKIDFTESKLLDSAKYDDKNRMIWHGTKYRYETFNYDKNNNITTFEKYREDKSGKKLLLRQEFEYDDKNNIVKCSKNDSNSSNPTVYTQKFIYKNGLLQEVQSSSEKFPIATKIIFEYNDKNQLIKKLEYAPKSFSNQNTSENGFELRDETQYIYGDKSLIIKYKYGTIEKFTFY